jgi:hypothetical protein
MYGVANVSTDVLIDDGLDLAAEVASQIEARPPPVRAAIAASCAAEAVTIPNSFPGSELSYFPRRSRRGFLYFARNKY